MKKKWLKRMLLLLLLIAVICIWPQKNFNLESVESIEILDSNHSRRRILTRENDTDLIEEIIARTKSLNLYRYFTIFKRAGFSISVVFYNADGQMLDSFSAISGHKIYANRGDLFIAFFQAWMRLFMNHSVQNKYAIIITLNGWDRSIDYTLYSNIDARNAFYIAY